MIIKRFANFLNESVNTVKKLVAVYNPDNEVFDHMGQNKKENKLEQFFHVVKDEPAYKKYFDETRGPVICYCKGGEEQINFMESVQQYNPYGIYNNYLLCEIGRTLTLKRMMSDGFKYTPKTLFNMEEAKAELELPVIGKAANSYDSKGVEKIDTWEQAKSSDIKFDLFQQAINIAHEYRVVVFITKTGKKIGVLNVFEKKPKNDKAKSLHEALTDKQLKNNENTKWYWHQLNRNEKNEDFYKAVSEIVSYLMTTNPGMNFTGLDLAEDKDGKIWYIEHNMLPAHLATQSIMLYKAIYEDYYLKPLDRPTITHMRALATTYVERMNRKMPFTAEKEKDIKIKWL